MASLEQVILKLDNSQFLKSLNQPNENIKREDFRFYVATNYLYFFCLIIHFFLLIIFTCLEVNIMAVFNVFSCAVFLAVLQINKKGKLNTAYNFAIAEVALHAALATVCLGWESNFCFYSMYLCCFIMFTPFLTLRIKVIETALTSILFVIAYIIVLVSNPIYQLDKGILGAIGAINIAAIISLLSFIFYLYFKITDDLGKKLKRAAEVDGLTGAYNRRFFNEYLEIEVKRILNQLQYNTAECQIDFGIAIIDIDDFKKINDIYGHLAGDNVLKQVVQIIKAAIFSRDIVCRYGGEEFVILFTQASNEGAVRTAEKIRKGIQEHSFYLNDDVKEGHITVSIGFASFSEGCSSDVNSILEIADARLYAAKIQGKNKVIYQ